MLKVREYAIEALPRGIGGGILCGGRSWRASPPRAPDPRSGVSREPELRHPLTPTPKASDTGTEMAPNNSPCARKISR